MHEAANCIHMMTEYCRYKVTSVEQHIEELVQAQMICMHDD